MDQTIITTSQLTKIYPGTTALDKVDFAVYKGKVNVLIGENGAGKSTLMKLIAGVEKPSSGVIHLNDTQLILNSVKDAEKHGIGIIFQELNLIPYMSVVDNMFLAVEKKKFGTVQIKKEKEQAAKILKRLELDVDLDTHIADLRVGQQQLIEIAKALVKDVNILIMDEPTSALSAAEVEVLFRVIENLKAQGVTVIYISHRLEELIRIGDYITILRDGKLVTTIKNDNISVEWIVEKMVGNVVRKKHKPRKVEQKDPVIELKNITLYDNSGKKRLKDVSLEMYKGELLGIYGLMGAGRTELFEAIIGAQKISQGKIIFNGQEVHKKTLSNRLHSGMALVPEDRKNQAVIPTMSVLQNTSIASLMRISNKGFWINNIAERKIVKEKVDELSIKTSKLDTLLTALSGGNQQKVIIAKSLATLPKLLLLDDCSRGVDVGAKAEIFEIIHKLVDIGDIGVAFTSSDLNEIMDNADRILVISNGKLVGEFFPSETSEAQLVDASALELGK